MCGFLFYVFFVIYSVVLWFHIHFSIFGVFVVVLVVYNDLHRYFDVCCWIHFFGASKRFCACAVLLGMFNCCRRGRRLPGGFCDFTCMFVTACLGSVGGV